MKGFRDLVNLALLMSSVSCIASLLYSCNKDAIFPEAHSTSQIVQKIETQYAQGQEKVENDMHHEDESFASDDVLSEIRAKIMEPRVWNLYIDNEDKNNKNILAEGDFSPNFLNSNGTHLQFWAISGKNTPGQNQDTQFPDLGFSYGVFGTFSSPVVGGAGGTGVVKTDDENNNNANQLYSVDWLTSVATNATHTQGYGVDRTNDPGNTTFNIRRAR